MCLLGLIGIHVIKFPGLLIWVVFIDIFMPVFHLRSVSQPKRLQLFINSGKKTIMFYIFTLVTNQLVFERG